MKADLFAVGWHLWSSLVSVYRLSVYLCRWIAKIFTTLCNGCILPYACKLSIERDKVMWWNVLSLHCVPTSYYVSSFLWALYIVLFRYVSSPQVICPSVFILNHLRFRWKVQYSTPFQIFIFHLRLKWSSPAWVKKTPDLRNAGYLTPCL